jgi:hypothetical protein
MFTLAAFGESKEVFTLVEGETSKDEFASGVRQHAEKELENDRGDIDLERIMTDSRGLDVDVRIV